MMWANNLLQIVPLDALIAGEFEWYTGGGDERHDIDKDTAIDGVSSEVEWLINLNKEVGHWCFIRKV
jgi:hypothetical protein